MKEGQGNKNNEKEMVHEYHLYIKKGLACDDKRPWLEIKIFKH